jgi:hypothetical protein
MRPLFLLFSFFALFAIASAQAQIGATTKQTANQTLNTANSTLELVNESGYLIFYPNLTQAYADLSKAQSLYNTSPSGTIVFADKAMNEANAEYQRISGYRTYSMVAMLVFTVFFLVLLFRVIVPVKTARRRISK